MDSDGTVPPPPRRYLIATAVAQHAHAPQWDRPGLVDARNEIIAFFTGALGYQHVSDLGLNPTKDQLTRQLRGFCRSPERRPDDIVAVYVAGHGEILEDGQEHVLLTADTDPDDIADALPTAELARKMLLDTPVRRVLLMLDACYSGRGGNDLAAAALTRMTQRWSDDHGSGLVVVTSTQPAEQALTGAFPQLLRDAVESLPVAGYTPATLALDVVVQAMNDNPRRPAFQTITSTLAQLTGEVPPFFPNPRHDPRMTEVDLAIQQAMERDAQAERRDVELRTRLLVRAMGGHDPAQGWWFSGRRTALIDITDWLTHPDPSLPMLAVTAAPGSGKTAVLGLIASLAHPERRRTVPIDRLALPPTAVPPSGAVDVAVYAQNLTTIQVFEGITAAAQLRTGSPGMLLGHLRGRQTPFTVLVDALDEASDPQDLAQHLLRPLAEYAQGRVRLLVGTRPHLLADLGLSRDDCVDLDAPRYADLDALTTYAARGLLDSTPRSPYRRASPTTVRAVADAVAQAAEPSFLVARITSSTLAAADAVPDLRDLAWRQSLPRLPNHAMRRDLQTRLGDDAERARHLLRPLAYAEGQGLPWEDIWAPLASRIAGVTYSDDDLLWLRRHAGSYVVEAIEAGRSAYRLYHQALAEHLRESVADATVHQAFSAVLLDHVPLTLDGSRDWSRAHPYTLRHLATHAAGCGLLDDLIADTDYLVHAKPDELLIAMYKVTSDHGRLTSAIYLSSAAEHRKVDPPQRRLVLAIDAARFRAAEIQRRLTKSLEWAPRWATGQQAHPALRASFMVHESAVRAVACTTIDDHPVAVTGSEDETVRVWDLTTGELRLRLADHEESVYAVACTTIGGRPIAVTGGRDKTVRVWDLSTGELRATFTGHKEAVRAVACTMIDDQPIAVTGGDDKTVRVWDLATGAMRATLTGHKSTVYAVACTDMYGRAVAVTCDGNAITRLWHLTGPIQEPVMPGHTNDIEVVASTLVYGRPVAVTGGDDRTVRIWDLTTGELRTTLNGHKGTVYAAACTRVRGRPVAITGSDDRTMQVWDLATRKLRATLTGHKGTVGAVACTMIDGQPIAVSGGHDKTIRVWDLTTGEHRATFTDLENAVLVVACAMIDGRPVAAAGGDGTTVHMWDLHSNRSLAVLDLVRANPIAMCFGPTQELIVGNGWELVAIDRQYTK